MEKLANIDLNLLVVFDLLYQEQNTQRVALRLGITQPAVSHALKRLRHLLEDELFERTSQGLQPTPRASRLHPGIADALARMNDTLNLCDDFNPAKSERTFHINMTDIGEIVFLPRLLQHLSHHAPGVSLNTVRSHHNDLKNEMEEGEIDLAVGLIPQLGAGFYQQRLFVQRYVCLMREHHPLAAEEFSLEAFRTAHHAVVVARGTGHGIIEEQLAHAGVVRPVRLTLPHFAAVPYIVSSSDLVVTVTDKLAEATRTRFGLAIREHPLTFPEIPINLFWHRRFHQDPGNRWLRGLMFSLFSE
ncbi:MULTISPECIES: LysR family transcriptional regulator [Halomonadaceae]|uniref:PCP degradation transcriptional activation protein n=1 Tax=Vreelandella titanicae TaxID=664683 RepID=A0AAP9NPG7_9GAMM|nr:MULTISPECIES: LysR family transcriptional regulator [Halomonas]AJY48736.1 transcriptional regulator, LysR family [Halomonas sp. KO116]MCD1589036.1 LysR family transcriptional regulator [Halomonas sp. IOP_14]QKS26068.1 PCP degradation transcriptional activation protein [Halomonas titanicae]CDG52747.1 HTH-type transcriptional activator NahR [Halomonas sp. A3H3]